LKRGNEMAKKKATTNEKVDTDPEEIEDRSIEEQMETPMIRSPCFEKKYVTRIIPFFTEFDVRMNLCNETMKTEMGWNLVTDEMIILTPTAAKELLIELTDLIKAYEELNGPIKQRPQNKVITTFTRKE